MYVVVQNKALALDELGQPIICNLIRDEHDCMIEWVDWDSADLIDWLDLPPTTNKVYRQAIDLIQNCSQKAYYVK
jgi:hypothetical protein